MCVALGLQRICLGANWIIDVHGARESWSTLQKSFSSRLRSINRSLEMGLGFPEAYAGFVCSP